MSMDIIADALLGFATCESNIKSFSQILKSLHSIDSLHRLKEKADVVEVLLVIASFAPLFALPAVPASSMTIDIDESSVGARLGHLEHRAEMLRRDQLAVIGERQDETTAFTHTPPLAYPSTLEGGPDDDVRPPEEVLPSFQSISRTSSQPTPPAYLLHPVRHSELIPSASEGIPLYSFLIHFPVFSAVGARLGSLDRENLALLPAMAKWGFGNSMATFAYPCLRLTNGGTACIVVDDDLKRLEEIMKDLEGAERELWDKNVADMLDRTFFIVGTWKEEHVALAFSLSYGIHYQQELGDFERWTTPDALWKDISRIHPVLSQYQEITATSGQEREGSHGRPLLGAKLFYRKQASSARDYNDHLLTLVVPLLGCPHALMFANDFAAQHSTIKLVAAATIQPASSTAVHAGATHNVGVCVVKMGPPPLEGDEYWDGLVLRNDKWVDVYDMKFNTFIYTPPEYDI